MSFVRKLRAYSNLNCAVLLFFTLAGICFGQSNWESINPLPTGNDLTFVTYGNNQYIALDTAGTIFTSPNCTTWTINSSGTTNRLNAVVYANNQFVAVGASGTILISPNGSTWVTKNSGTTKKLNSVTYGNSQFVTVGDSGTILTSPDGTTWTINNSGSAKDLESVTYGNSQFVAVANSHSVPAEGTSGIILTSPDGTAWTIQNSGLVDRMYSDNYLAAVTYGNGKYVVVGTYSGGYNNYSFHGAIVLTSLDGTTWTRTNNTTNTNAYLHSVVYGNSQFVAVGTCGEIITSRDGTTWTTTNSGYQMLSSVTYGNSQFVAVGDGKILVSNIITDNCKATYIGNGTIDFEVTFAKVQQYVELFVRQNGIQNVTQNITDTVIYNADGKVTYKFSQSGYNSDDFVEYRFYSYDTNSSGVFIPGPIENSWDNLTVAR